jgi:D-3-phosphoglycerate dehydrogenase / 2-oxoglutarate reductase
MKILIIDIYYKALVDILETNGFKCHYGKNFSENELLEKIVSFDGVITNNKLVFSKPVIDKAINLKFIGCMGIGLENIDNEYATNKGIKCLSASEGNRDAVGEYAIALILNLLNNLCRANMQVKNGIWKRESNQGVEIYGKTIGILGYGNTGSAFAKKLSGFDVKVLAFDKYKIDYQDNFCIESSMDEIYQNCDILSLHLPLTKETYNLVDYQYIKRFKKNIYIINTSRGSVIKTEDLSKAINDGKVLGAALDVLEYERTSFEKLHFGTMPESLQYLVDNDNVILSPHIAGLTKESEYKTATILAEKIIQIFKNQND